jgi:hypothetical protein
MPIILPTVGIATMKKTKSLVPPLSAGPSNGKDSAEPSEETRPETADVQTGLDEIFPLSGFCPGGSVSQGICTPFSNIYRSTWMSAYPSARHLRIVDCTLPGTHDSGFDMEAPYTNSIETCQDVSPFKQLMAGIRVLDLRVQFFPGYPAGAPGRFSIFHDGNSGRTVKVDILDKLLEFHRHSADQGDAKKEIVILDFHQFKDFNDAAHEELAQLIKEKLEMSIIPPWMSDLTIVQTWQVANLNVIIAYNANPRDRLFWAGVNQRWIGENVVTSDELKRFMDDVALESKPRGELRSIQSAKYVQTLPVPVPDDISKSLWEWFGAETVDSYINKFFIINTDWSLRQRLIDNCIYSNMLKVSQVESVFGFLVPQGDSVTLPSGHRAMIVYIDNGQWAAIIRLPDTAPEYATIIICHLATYESHLVTTNTDFPAEELVLNEGDVLMLTRLSGRWSILKPVELADARMTVIRNPRRYEKVMLHTLADGQFVQHFSLPDTAAHHSYIIIKSQATMTATLSGTNLEQGQDLAIPFGFFGMFVFDSSVGKWTYIEIDDGTSPVPVPANFRLAHNNYYPVKLLWSPSSEAVKYKVYRWFREIAEVTGTEFTSDVTGYNRFHLKAVDAAGRLSAATAFVFFFPPS